MASRIGTQPIPEKKYRLPQRVGDLVYRFWFEFINLTGHVIIHNSPANLLWVFDPATGHLTVEGVGTDRYLNFEYRGTDGHVIENT